MSWTEEQARRFHACPVKEQLRAVRRMIAVDAYETYRTIGFRHCAAIRMVACDLKISPAALRKWLKWVHGHRLSGRGTLLWLLVDRRLEGGAA